MLGQSLLLLTLTQLGSVFCNTFECILSVTEIIPEPSKPRAQDFDKVMEFHKEITGYLEEQRTQQESQLPCSWKHRSAAEVSNLPAGCHRGTEKLEGRTNFEEFLFPAMVSGSRRAQMPNDTIPCVQKP